MAKARAKAICDMERPSARAAGVAGSMLGAIVASRRKPNAKSQSHLDNPVSRRRDAPILHLVRGLPGATPPRTRHSSSTATPQLLRFLSSPPSAVCAILAQAPPPPSPPRLSTVFTKSSEPPPGLRAPCRREGGWRGVHAPTYFATEDEGSEGPHPRRCNLFATSAPRGLETFPGTGFSSWVVF